MKNPLRAEPGQRPRLWKRWVGCFIQRQRGLDQSLYFKSMRLTMMGLSDSELLQKRVGEVVGVISHLQGMLSHEAYSDGSVGVG